MVSAGSYALSAIELGLLVASLAASALLVRRRILPAWSGAPARLAESILAVSLLVLISEILGLFSALEAWSLLAASLLLAAALLWRLGAPRPAARPDGLERSAPRGSAAYLKAFVTTGIVTVVTAHWGIEAKQALDAGIGNFDSLWYHMPFAAEIARSGSVTGLHYTETVFTNWFYPQNSELIHAAGILLADRDTLSLFINFGWLAIAFLAAWCVGRPFGRGHLSVAAVAIVLGCHTLVVREPGAAKNDLAAAALLLAAVAILVTAWAESAEGRAGGEERAEGAGSPPGAGGAPLPAWGVMVAGLAAGLAAGTKVTALAPLAALSVAVIALAPGVRRRAAAWWFLPALASGGYWYLRNLVVAGNPIPQIRHLGPLALPGPERLQTARPDFTILHYATDTGVWRDYFAPGLHNAFGTLWPLVVLGGLAGAILAIVAGAPKLRPEGRGSFSRHNREKEPRPAKRAGPDAIRWMGVVALVGLVAYLATPLSAAGAEGAPEAFGINIRFVVPALLLALALLPLAPGLESERAQWALLALLVAVLVVSNRSDVVLRDPDRLFGLLVAGLAVLIPAVLLLAHYRGAGRGPLVAGVAALLLAVVALGYPAQRHYLRERFAAGIPGMGLDAAYRWARGVEDARIGLAGTTAGFLQYGFFGTDLSNQVRYLGEKGPHGAFNAIATCADFRRAVNDARLDYLITAPFLNFIHPSRPIESPEAGWLRGEPAVRAIRRDGDVTVWEVRGRLSPAGCGPLNAPLRRVPDAPVA